MATRLLPPLPPTTPELLSPDAHPYFLWWSDVTVQGLHALLRSDDPDERAYWLGAVMREANTRDVWLFTSPARIRALWPRLLRHLGHSRAMWAWLLQAGDEAWPPKEVRGA